MVVVVENANLHVLLTFDRVHNPLRLPREATSGPPKVARTCGVLYILTSKCALRHNGVHFFDMSTSKSGPELVCFIPCASRHNGVHMSNLNFQKWSEHLSFDFEMCFAPQRRALFRHLNFQKWSDPLVFCPF